jgi:hypothetical protein
MKVEMIEPSAWKVSTPISPSRLIPVAKLVPSVAILNAPSAEVLLATGNFVPTTASRRRASSDSIGELMRMQSVSPQTDVRFGRIL